ncbi:ribosomal protein S27e, Zinc-binding ribosomal protein [Artemisia annua]|uniref:Ribosomal protein S27e, Zinc-binding ribosomal protein n=1 Tax=Artemisia annua TaxID=35608 RepID=A0A2U1NPK6_ARTAN|nr:ribosomal protein S27e, Zinc-binding ribosomal protein [Artemisia annua]
METVEHAYKWITTVASWLPLPLSYPSTLIGRLMPNHVYELYPPAELEKRKQELKRRFPFPNSFFMDVRCHGCLLVTTPVYSHTQTVVDCANCFMVLCKPTGARARVTEGCSFRRKTDD